jgi:hypothetical protein
MTCATETVEKRMIKISLKNIISLLYIIYYNTIYI